jgi:hypothetical protein
MGRYQTFTKIQGDIHNFMFVSGVYDKCKQHPAKKLSLVLLIPATNLTPCPRFSLNLSVIYGRYQQHQRQFFSSNIALPTPPSQKTVK